MKLTASLTLLGGLTFAGVGALALAPGEDVPVDTPVSTASIAGSDATPMAFRDTPEDAQEFQAPSLSAPWTSGEFREFHFTRAMYTSAGGWGWGGRGRGRWATDYPKADLQFLYVINGLIDIDAYERQNPMQLDDPELRRYPFLYALEVGAMRLSEPELEGLRNYLLAGGFLMIDDFWGEAEWWNFEYEMSRLFPEYPIVEIPMDHPIFNMVYQIDEIIQVPNIGNARIGRTSEKGGIVPHVRGIFDDEDRLMVIINFNTDLGDAWEWAEDPFYPIRFSSYAMEITANTIVYAMSH